MESISETAKELRLEIARLKSQTKTLEQHLDHLERACDHAWTEPEEQIRIEDALEVTGGKYMGVDYMPEYSFREKRVPVWVRVCNRCGRREETRRTTTTTIMTEKPIFK